MPTTKPKPRKNDFGASREVLSTPFFLQALRSRTWEVANGRCTFLGVQERGSLNVFFASFPFRGKQISAVRLLRNAACEELLLFKPDILLGRVLGDSLGAAFPRIQCKSLGGWQCVSEAGHDIARRLFTRKPGFLASQANGFVNRLEEMYKTYTEVAEHVPNHVWSQESFPQVGVGLLQKRDWRIVISKRWKLGDDSLLGGPGSLFRCPHVMGVFGTCSHCWTLPPWTLAETSAEHVVSMAARVLQRPRFAREASRHLLVAFGVRCVIAFVFFLLSARAKIYQLCCSLATSKSGYGCSHCPFSCYTHSRVTKNSAVGTLASISLCFQVDMSEWHRYFHGNMFWVGAISTRSSDKALLYDSVFSSLRRLCPCVGGFSRHDP